MGILQKIENTINSTVSHYGHIKVFPRGLPNFVDSLLRGTVRFGKRTGNGIAVINPDNTFFFEEAPLKRTSVLKLTKTSNWFTTDAIVSVGPGKEFHVIDDIIGNELHLKSELSGGYTTDDSVLLHSYPMLVAINASVGADTIIVKSRYNLGNGDVFSYLQSEQFIQSITELEVEKALYLGTTSDPFFTYLYSLKLKGNIQRSFSSGSLVYIRAFPAYFSSVIPVPNSFFTSEPMGPFLVDLFSGRLLEGKNFKETLGLKTINRNGGYVLGGASEYVTVDKNYLILDRPFAAHYPMFWDLAEGTMRMTPTRMVFRVNDKSQFCAGIKCVPPIIGNNKYWRLSIQTTDDMTIRVFFRPDETPQEFNFLSGESKAIQIQIPDGYPIDGIEINILAASSAAEVKLTDWSPVTDTVDTIEYSVVVQAIGDATYQSTGLVLKPYFLGPEYLKATYDYRDKYDGGKIYF